MVQLNGKGERDPHLLTGLMRAGAVLFEHLFLLVYWLMVPHEGVMHIDFIIICGTLGLVFLVAGSEKNSSIYYQGAVLPLAMMVFGIFHCNSEWLLPIKTFLEILALQVVFIVFTEQCSGEEREKEKHILYMSHRNYWDV